MQKGAGEAVKPWLQGLALGARNAGHLRWKNPNLQTAA
jgi:hypothetical protein